MSRFRLLPTPEQEQALLGHCRDARYVWNLAEARAEYEWLGAGSQTVQQQALRDFAQAMRNFFRGTSPPDVA
jgi:putative transposase